MRIKRLKIFLLAAIIFVVNCLIPIRIHAVEMDELTENFLNQFASKWQLFW